MSFTLLVVLVLMALSLVASLTETHCQRHGTSVRQWPAQRRARVLARYESRYRPRHYVQATA